MNGLFIAPSERKTCGSQENKNQHPAKHAFISFKDLEEDDKNMTNIEPNPSNIQPFPSSHSLPFVPLVCAFAASHTHTNTLEVGERQLPYQPAPTSLGVRNADVNGRDGRVGVVAVVLDEEGVLLPGLLYHRHWSDGRRSSIRYTARAYTLWILDLRRFHTMPAESLVGLICLMWMQ